MAKPRIVCVVGTRPDTIKMAPVILSLRERTDVETLVVSTGQHREMLDQALAAFGLSADEDLAVMQHGQTLADVTSRVVSGLDKVLADREPNYVIAQGDTTTTFCASLGAFYRRIPFGHVEAGLRTDQIDNPFPEEFNRRASGLISTHHFAPTEWAAQNLRNEGKDEPSIFVTGNTGIDAVKAIAQREEQDWYLDSDRRIVLLTTHRRENWGEAQQQIARAALRIVEQFPDTQLVVPMHRNPQVRETLNSILGGKDRVDLIEPPDYGKFAKLLERSYLVLTDSGGVQEEAPTFGKPILVLRETTERPEGVERGTAKLIGTDERRIFDEASLLLSDPAEYARMASAQSPYGDGKAAERIRMVVFRSLGISHEDVPMWM